MASSHEVHLLPEKVFLSCCSDLLSGVLWDCVSGSCVRLVLVWVLCEPFGWLPGNSCSGSNQAMGHSVGVRAPLELQMHRNPRCFDSIRPDQMYRVCAIGGICTWLINPAYMRWRTLRPIWPKYWVSFCVRKIWNCKVRHNQRFLPIFNFQCSSF